MTWHFELIRSTGFAIAGAVMSGAFYFAGYMAGRKRQQETTQAILAAIFEKERLVLERAQELRRLELEDRGRRLLDRA